MTLPELIAALEKAEVGSRELDLEMEKKNEAAERRGRGRPS